MALDEKNRAELVNQIGKKKHDQGSQQLDAYDGEAEGCCNKRNNQLEKKPAEKPNDLLSMMNKVAQSSSRVGKNRTRAAQEHMRRDL
ncbi:hypothetical protein F511_31165 [Dorcoceras hygrometricum]|uniref:Uncharacterized protein n=1 Tax=Dorcoceras hygrometricum TaxID=472368 RepID=A0A2Z7DHP9_9LAMI|nr:hypothetical protein F511_31165 [Dorcoceras hygrometricum]